MGLVPGMTVLLPVNGHLFTFPNRIHTQKTERENWREEYTERNTQEAGKKKRERQVIYSLIT